MNLTPSPMPQSSRYVRPATPRRGIRLEPRDEAMLAALARFRLLTSAHMHELCCPSRTLRVAQGRLRLLWEHGFVDRVELPLQVGRSIQDRTGPVYALSRHGAGELVDRGHDLAPTTEWGFPSRGFGGAALHHHLVVSDVLAALDVALGKRSDVTLAEVSPERSFRAKIESLRSHQALPKPYVIPDGGFTLRRGSGPARTFYLEIVRADVRGGTSTLRDKLEKYVALNRAGAFRTLYGHDHLRAVLFLTTSPARAERLRALAKGLAHSRKLFWFGAYRAPAGRGRLERTLSSRTILDARWTSGDGEAVGFIEDRHPHVLPRA